MPYLKIEIGRLKDQTIDMMYLVRTQVARTRDAFLRFDKELSKEIIHYEKRVNGSELSIDRDCEKILALYKPAAAELRFIIATLKVNNHLERMGDHAKGISQYILHLEKPFDPALLEAIRLAEMFETVLSMMDDAIHAFNFENTQLAQWVFGKDATINDINRMGIERIIAYAKDAPGDVANCFHLFSTLKKIERLGDLTKSIAEETIFYTEAKVLRHQGKTLHD